MISLKIRNEIRKHAEEHKNEEVCGLILLINNDYKVFPCENVSFNKKEHSILNVLDYIKAEKIGEIVGTYHSQENDGPSLIDNLTSDSHNIFSIIYCWKLDKFYVIKPQLINYLYKDFKIGEHDCFTLVKNYYYKQLNISLNNYERKDNWHIDNPKLILQGFKKEGFTVVEDRKMHDIILFGKNSNNLYHMGVYLKNNMFIHHPRNSKSVIEELGHWNSKLILTIRHKSLL